MRAVREAGTTSSPARPSTRTTAASSGRRVTASIDTDGGGDVTNCLSFPATRTAKRRSAKWPAVEARLTEQLARERRQLRTTSAPSRSRRTAPEQTLNEVVGGRGHRLQPAAPAELLGSSGHPAGAAAARVRWLCASSGCDSPLGGSDNRPVRPADDVDRLRHDRGSSGGGWIADGTHCSRSTATSYCDPTGMICRAPRRPLLRRRRQAALPVDRRRAPAYLQ